MIATEPLGISKQTPSGGTKKWTSCWWPYERTPSCPIDASGTYRRLGTFLSFVRCELMRGERERRGERRCQTAPRRPWTAGVDQFLQKMMGRLTLLVLFFCCPCFHCSLARPEMALLRGTPAHRIRPRNPKGNFKQISGDHWVRRSRRIINRPPSPSVFIFTNFCFLFFVI